MVHVAVGDEDLLDLDPRLTNRLAQFGEVAARIDERAPIGLGAPEQRAILLKGGDGHDRGAQRRIGSVHAPDVVKAREFGKPGAAQRSVIVSPSTFTASSFAR
jgi:hypothetical protein